MISSDFFKREKTTTKNPTRAASSIEVRTWRRLLPVQILPSAHKISLNVYTATRPNAERVSHDVRDHRVMWWSKSKKNRSNSRLEECCPLVGMRTRCLFFSSYLSVHPLRFMCTLTRKKELMRSYNPPVIVEGVGNGGVGTRGTWQSPPRKKILRWQECERCMFAVSMEFVHPWAYILCIFTLYYVRVSTIIFT